MDRSPRQLELAHPHAESSPLDRLEAHAAELAGYAKRLKSVALQARKSMAAKPTSADPVRRLITALRSLPAAPSSLDLNAVVAALEQSASSVHQRLEQSFGTRLQEACDAAGWSVRVISGGYAVGPFSLQVDLAKGIGHLQYAKVDVERNIPLDGAVVLDRAAKHKQQIIDQSVDRVALLGVVEQAMRVAWVRRNRSFKNDLRVELPGLFEEMRLIRQGSSTRGKGGAVYSVPRFVVEISALVQSDENLNSARPLQLESAVLDNAKDPRKSIFFPKDLNNGFGEGVYFQAIVQRGA